MLIMLKTHRASDIMSALNLIHIMLLHAYKSTASTTTALIPAQNGCTINGTNGIMPELHGQQSFIKSIAGE